MVWIEVDATLTWAEKNHELEWPLISIHFFLFIVFVIKWIRLCCEPIQRMATFIVSETSIIVRNSTLHLETAWH